MAGKQIEGIHYREEVDERRCNSVSSFVDGGKLLV